MASVRLLVLAVVLAVGAPVLAEDEAPPNPIEALVASWQAAPQDLALGLRLQEAMLEAGLRMRQRSLFRRASEAKPADLVLQFLYGRARQDARGLELMRSAFAQDLGNAAGETRGLLAAAIPLAVEEVAAGNGASAARIAARITQLRGVAADWVYLAWISRALLKDAAGAEEAYRSALRVQGDHLGARTALVALLLERDAVPEALALAKTGVTQHPESSSAHLSLGGAHAAAKKAEEAKQAFMQAHALAAGNAGALAAVGSALLEAGDKDQARRALTQSLELDPLHGRALTAAGRLALSEGRLKEARQLLVRAGRVRPQSARVAYFQGVCAQRMGLHTSAVSSFGRAVKLEPERIEYVTALGLAYLEKGSASAAVRYLKRAIAMAPTDFELRMQLGIAYMKKRSYKDARDAFIEAAERDRESPRPFFYLAVIHGDKLGKSRDALEALRQYKALGGKAASALKWLASLEAQLGENKPR